MKLLDTSSQVPEDSVASPPASVQQREYVVHGASPVAPRCVQPRGAWERGLGQPRPPGCDQRSGRDHRPHTRPPPCRLPNWARPNPKQPSWWSAWRGPEDSPGVPEELTIAGRCRDHGPTRRCADLASCSEALDSGSIGRSRRDLVGWDSRRGRNQQPTPRHDARNSVPGPRRAGPQGHGGVFVAVPEPFPPEARSHHDELTEQPSR